MSRIIFVVSLLVMCYTAKAYGSVFDKFRKVDLFIEQNQLDSASNWLYKIRPSVKNEKNPVAQLKYLDLCASIQEKLGDFNCTFAYYDSISRIVSLVNPVNGSDSMLVARGYFCKATFLGAYNKFSESIEPYRKALSFLGSHPNDRFRSYCHQNLGLSYIRIGQVENGLLHVNNAFRIYEANKDYVGKFGCLGYIANTMVDYKNFGLARKYYKEALSLKDSIKNDSEKSGLLNDIGRMYNYEMKYDSSLVYFQLALEESKSIGNDYLIAIAQSNIGEILMKQENYDSAILILNEALLKFESMHFDLGVFQTNHLLAFCEYKRHDLRKAKFFQDHAEALMQKTEVYPTLLIDFYKRSYELKKGLGKLNESLRYLEKYQNMQDSVNSILTNWKVNEIESRLHTSIKEKQLIQKESELHAHKLAVWGMSSLFVLLILITGITALYLRKRRDIQYQKQMAQMTALKMQNARNTMSPHFFFNVLASLSGLSAQPERLKKKFQSLSLLLRKVIENIDQTAVPLESELEAVKAYIDLYRERIPGSFSEEYLIDADVNMQVLVPAMILQIPVENAIKHGLMPLDGDKKLMIGITRFDHHQKISITDNGIGLQASAGCSAGTGKGLKVLLQTIHLLNAKNQEKISFSIVEREPDHSRSSGTQVNIEIPLEFDYEV